MGKDRGDQNEQEKKSTQTLDLENKVLNQGLRGATDIPTVQSYVKPQPSNLKNENSIQNALDGFERVITKHIREVGDKTPSVLTHTEKTLIAKQLLSNSYPGNDGHCSSLPSLSFQHMPSLHIFQQYA